MKKIHTTWLDRKHVEKSLKMLFQVSELDKNIEVLEEQLIGVDVAYFSLLITVLRDTEGKLTAHHLSELIDKVFNEYEEPVDEEVK
jgi:hypothetical protein